LLRNSQKFSFASQPNSKKKEIKDKMKEPQSLCQGQRNFHVHEIRTSSCERDGRWEKKMGEKVKNVSRSCEREMRNKIGERVGE